MTQCTFGEVSGMVSGEGGEDDSWGKVENGAAHHPGWVYCGSETLVQVPLEILPLVPTLQEGRHTVPAQSRGLSYEELV